VVWYERVVVDSRGCWFTVYEFGQFWSATVGSRCSGSGRLGTPVVQAVAGRGSHQYVVAHPARRLLKLLDGGRSVEAARSWRAPSRAVAWQRIVVRSQARFNILFARDGVWGVLWVNGVNEVGHSSVTGPGLVATPPDA